ncbi:hypothetical protein [Clostridium paraputrificum]|jgi:hypothetical protein|nr:hypothetical protein [Clostridium paraputrificum]MDB2122180.1 hypothetical protein [Clostridium paraputrificum]
MEDLEKEINQLMKGLTREEARIVLINAMSIFKAEDKVRKNCP